MSCFLTQSFGLGEEFHSVPGPLSHRYRYCYVIENCYSIQLSETCDFAQVIEFSLKILDFVDVEFRWSWKLKTWAAFPVLSQTMQLIYGIIANIDIDGLNLCERLNNSRAH